MYIYITEHVQRISANINRWNLKTTLCFITSDFMILYRKKQNLVSKKFLDTELLYKMAE